MGWGSMLAGRAIAGRQMKKHRRILDENARARQSRPKKPRQYRPASHWRAELTRIDARLDALNGVQRHATDDPAAYGGVGVQQTVRQRRKYGDRIDRTAAE